MLLPKLYTSSFDTRLSQIYLKHIENCSPGYKVKEPECSVFSCQTILKRHFQS
uniref:Uncharacterized protein n=1 Tax=Arundo donax TaxID=35708 RepID=A0A0A9FNF2_ARUDO